METASAAMPRPFFGLTPSAPANRVRRSHAVILCEAVLLVAAIGWFDYFTGDLAITIFYFCPVALAAWRAGRGAGWFIALLSGLTWLISDLTLHQQDRALAMPYLNAVMLVMVCGTIVELLLSLRKAQDALRARLELRTVSLAEVHHRVKNNLQVISSLLLLQSDKVADAVIRNVFAECRDRINAMARLHEQLYADSGSAQLDFTAHVHELAETLLQSHTPPGCDRPTLDIHADRVELDIDRGMRLSVATTELVLNALKHGFKGRGEGKLEMELRNSAGCVMLTVRDDGPGIPPGFLVGGDGSSGLDLVNAIALQLGGELTIGNDPAGGTCATLLLPSEVQHYQQQVLETSTQLI